MADVFNGWSTNFIYQQDLTSYHMNNALRSVIKPGIYNANMAIYSEGNSSDGALYLTIKKGTTFVFSNDYEIPYSDFGIRRSIRPSSNNFVGLSNNNRMALIKSVALRDISVKIHNKGSLDPNGKIYSLHAYMKYNPLTEGGVNAQSSPLFFLSKENDSDESEGYSRALYNPLGKLWGSKTDGDSIMVYDISLGAVPDGLNINPLDGETSFGPVLNEYFLQVGFIVPKKAGSGLKFNDYAFTGRGLPEYRHSLGDDSEVLTPDIIPNALGIFDKVFFDIPLSYTGTAVLEHRIADNSNTPDNDWETAYLSRRASDANNRDSVSIESDGRTEVVYACVSNIRSYSTPNIHSYEESLSIDPNDTFDISFHSIPVDGLVLEDTSISMTPWIAESKIETDTMVIPLDISRINQDRLLRRIKGKDIVSSLIDYIRMTPSYDPNYITDIIPIAIVFKKTGEGLDPTNMISYFDLRNKMSQINSLDVVEHNIFNLIPVMN